MAELERKAGYGLVIALSITSMVGTGMFFGPAIAAQYAGNASLLTWLLLSLITVYVGACFAELSSMFSNVGGVYEFAKKAYGRFPSFMVGWITWLVGSITPAVLIIAGLDYVLPNVSVLVKVLIGIFLIVILNMVALRGIEASTFLLLFFAFIIVSIVFAVILVGFFHINFSNFTPFFNGPLFNGLLPTKNFFLIFVALFYIVESFFGWESVTFMAGETRNPERIIPRTLIIVSVFVSVLGLLMAFVTLGIFPWQTLIKFSTPLTNIAFVLFGSKGASLVNILIFVALIGSAAGGIVSSPRLLVALANDKLFIEQLSAIHPKFKTPYKAIFFQMVVTIIVLIMAVGNYKSLLALLVPLALMMYISIILIVPVLRIKSPAIRRGFRVPFGVIGPVLVSLFYLGVIVLWLLLEPNAFSLFRKILSFLFFGIPIYLLINMYYNPDLLQKTVGSFAPLSRFFEAFLLPKSVRNDIIHLFSGLEGKRVLEFGCGVGSLTLVLSKAVGPKGRVYAVDFSEQNLDVLQNRIVDNDITNVFVIHDEHLISRVHPSIPSVDMVFSVGNLSYIQNLRAVLKSLHSLLPDHGRICFVEYVDYFWGVIPNQSWLDDWSRIQSLFRSVGFSITIRKRRGLFWNYLYVYGIKSDYDVPVI